MSKTLRKIKDLMHYRSLNLAGLAIALSVLSILAAVFIQLVNNYIEQVRITAATADIRSVVQAYRLYKRDTGYFPIYTNATDAINDIPTAKEMATDGDLPVIIGAHWTLTSSGSIHDSLNTNKLGLAVNGLGTGGMVYKGPYLEFINSDPWGNQYLVNTINLVRSSTKIGFIISAGPDGKLDTGRDQLASNTLRIIGDDLAARIK